MLWVALWETVTHSTLVVHSVGVLFFVDHSAYSEVEVIGLTQNIIFLEKISQK